MAFYLLPASQLGVWIPRTLDLQYFIRYLDGVFGLEAALSFFEGGVIMDFEGNIFDTLRLWLLRES